MYEKCVMWIQGTVVTADAVLMFALSWAAAMVKVISLSVLVAHLLY